MTALQHMLIALLLRVEAWAATKAVLTARPQQQHVFMKIRVHAHVGLIAHAGLHDCMQVLRVVESLPLTPDDLHTVTSAQGCFADTLRELVTHPYLDASAEVCHALP